MPEVLATFYEQETPATAYLRCELPARYLPGVVRKELAPAFSEDDVCFPEQEGDVAIFQFPADQARALVSQVMRTQGIKVFVEVDDNYLIHPGKEILERSGWSMKIGEETHSRQGHRWISEHADGVIVTTPMLAQAYGKLNANVHICPNTVDPVDWPEPEKPDDGIFRIAWIASKSHWDDIKLITKAFEWASRQPDVEVYVGGINPLWDFRYGFLPWLSDLADYRKLFQTFDVGVAPILGQPFALYRSDIKACEIAMGLGAPVLSDVAPYAAWVAGETCLKAEHRNDFLRVIQFLVSHRDEAKDIARAAREYVLRERTTEAQIGLWREAIAA